MHRKTFITKNGVPVLKNEKKVPCRFVCQNMASIYRSNISKPPKNELNLQKLHNIKEVP